MLCSQHVAGKDLISSIVSLREGGAKESLRGRRGSECNPVSDNPQMPGSPEAAAVGQPLAFHCLGSALKHQKPRLAGLGARLLGKSPEAPACRDPVTL